MKQQRNRFWLPLIAFLVLAALYVAVPVSAGVNYQSGACVEIADTLEPIVWVPVGCEIVDCCPGCPGNVIDWRIRVGGEPLEKLVLQFENLPADIARRLVIKGNARWVGSALHIGKGETTISGFKRDPGAVPAVAIPRLFANRAVVKRLQEAAASKSTGELGNMEVTIDQMIGKYVVNEARVAYNVVRCPNIPSNTDHLALSNNTAGDNVVVLLDGRNGSSVCVDDEDYRGTQTVFVGDIRSNATCNSEVSIFSDDNGMAFLTPVFWSDSIFDAQPVTLPPIREAPVAVWIVDNLSGTQERAEWEMASANYYYNLNNVGISFNATYQNISNNAGAVQTISQGCTNVGNIKSSGFFRSGRLNVYYINNPTATWRGSNCWGSEPNMIFINRTSGQETLAHEFGHAFSLDHSNGISGFGGNNIMWSRSLGRDHFSVGQAFRMNLNVTSMLNKNGVRVGRVRDPACADATTDNLCPRLALDVTPK